MKRHLNVSSTQLMLPPYDTFPELSSDNILLRQILPEDINNIVEISFYNAKVAASSEEALEMLNKINNDYNNGRTLHWGIVDTKSNIILGSCGYYRGFENQTGELGCVLKSEFSGKGYMTSAMKLAIDFGFSTIGLIKIFAITTKQNIKALKLIERLGFVKATELEGDKVEFDLRVRQK